MKISVVVNFTSVDDIHNKLQNFRDNGFNNCQLVG